jgi:hypothetical protein
MTKSQEFTIKVQSEDAKKKDKPLEDKSFKGSSKLLKDTKEDEGEELVRDGYSMCILRLNPPLYAVGGGSGFERTAGIIG